MTGTVQVEEVAPSVPTGSRPSPNQYCVPSGAVTFHRSPSLSPLAWSGSETKMRSTRQRASALSRHWLLFVFGTGTSSERTPLSETVALSVAQHRSLVPVSSFEQLL